MLKNLVLDIGNVICEWNPEALVASAVPDPAQRDSALAATIGHEDWLSLDRGTLSLDQAIANAQARTRDQVSPAAVEAIYRQLPASLVPLTDAVDAIHEAHSRGIALYVLSNMQWHAWHFMEREYDFWTLFSGILVSCDSGYIKPEAGIYNEVCSRFALQASDCLFIDDMPVNVQGARDCGWQAEHLATRERGGELIRSLFPRFAS